MMSSIVCCSVANFAPEMIEYYFFFPEKSKTPMPACVYAHSECLGAHSDPSIDQQPYNFKSLYAR